MGNVERGIAGQPLSACVHYNPPMRVAGARMLLAGHSAVPVSSFYHTWTSI